MEKLNIKPTHKPIRDYYGALKQYDRHNITHEGAVSNPFHYKCTLLAIPRIRTDTDELSASALPYLFSVALRSRHR